MNVISERGEESAENQQSRPSSNSSTGDSQMDSQSPSSSRELRDLANSPSSASSSGDGGNNLSEESDDLPPIVDIHLSFSRKLTVASGHILNGKSVEFGISESLQDYAYRTKNKSLTQISAQVKDLCASLWFSYLLLYLQKVIEFGVESNEDSKYAAGLMFLGQIVDGLATPLVGYEADQNQNSNFFGKNYGRCKSWHLIGVILVMISFPFIFSPCIGCTPHTSDWAKMIYYGPFIVIFQIGWASTQISHLALIPKMHPDELIRTELLAMRYAFTVASNVIIFLMTWYTLGNSTEMNIKPDDASNFMKIALTAVGIGGFFSLLFHIYVEEESDMKVKQTVAILECRRSVERLNRKYGLDNEEVHSSLPIYTSEGSRPSVVGCRRRTKSMGDALTSNPAENVIHEEEDEINSIPDVIHDDTQNLVEVDEQISALPVPQRESTISKLSTRHISLGKVEMSMRDWLTLPQFYLVALIYLSTRLSMNLSQIYVPLYLQDSLKLRPSTIATVPLTMYLSGFTVSLFVKVLNKHFGRQLAYIFGTLLLMAGSLLIFYLNWSGPETHFLKEYIIYFVAALLGGGASAILVTSLSITADLIGNNIENGAFVYGAMSFCDKLSCGIAVLLISALVPCSDEDDDDPVSEIIEIPCNKEDNIPFYRNLLAISSGGCALLGVLGIILLTLQIHLQNRLRL